MTHFDISPLLSSPTQLRLKALIPQLKEIIGSTQKIVVIGHRSPDGDALGSSLAWAEYLTQQGKQVQILMPNAFPDYYKWLPGSDRIIFADRQPVRTKAFLDNADLICLLDFNNLSRLQELGDLVAKSPARRLMVDHHLDPDSTAADLIISEPQISSTCELVCRLLIELNAFNQLTARGATALYCGMMTDTGSFTFNSNNPELYLLIAALLQKGIDKDRIYRYIYHTFSVNRLQLQGYILNEKLRFYENNHACLFSLTREDMKRFHFIRGDGEGIVNLPLQVQGMKLSISLREETEHDIIRVSLRSVDDFPCNEMAEQFFNGGGHLNASGGQLPFPMEDAIKTAEQAILAFRHRL